MKKVGLVFLGMMGLQTLSAQVYQPDQVAAKAVTLYEEAINWLQDQQMTKGIALLKNSVQIDSNFVDAYLSLGGVYGQLKKYDSSVYWYQKAQQKDTGYFKIYQLPLSINLAGNGNFSAALDAVNQFLNLPGLNEKSRKSGEYRKRCYEFALQYAAAYTGSEQSFLPVNLGDSVNTSRSEYYPTVTVTDTLLVFTRRDDHAREDFIESTIRPDGYGKWKTIPGSLNEEPKKGAISVSQDAEWLLYAAQLPDQAYRSFDIYLSLSTPQGWSDPLNMGPAINTEFWETAPSLSPDKNVLYFCSNRPGGYGGSDLYVSYRLPNGKWSQAENMGPGVNTAGDEMAPFIHADNQTLYFTSSGWPGYGGSDLFVLKKNTEGKWSAPINLGYPINTIENEGSMAVAADGSTAYYASDRADSRGGLDIYKFSLRKELQPHKTLYLKGQVKDKITGKLLPCLVELIENSQQKSLLKVQTDETGNYFITLPTGNDYTLTVNRKGYLFYSELFQLSNTVADSVYKKDVLLQPIQLNATLTFSNIQFTTNSFNLPESGKIELNKLITLLNENPGIRVEIGGHTDNIGLPENNRVLSENRAKAIVQYLQENKIAANRLSWKGYGSSQPIANNSTESGRALNRRTTFTIIGL